VAKGRGATRVQRGVRRPGELVSAEFCCSGGTIFVVTGSRAIVGVVHGKGPRFCGTVGVRVRGEVEGDKRGEWCLLQHLKRV